MTTRRSPVARELKSLAERRGCHALVVGMLRAFWLGLATIVAALALRMAGYVIAWELVLGIAVVAMLVMVAVAARRQASPEHIAKGLDRRFGLYEHVATAYEVGVPINEIEARLLRQAYHTLKLARRHPALAFKVPVREIETLLALGLILAGIWFLRGVNSGIPEVATRPLPPAVQEPGLPQPVQNPNPNIPPDVRDLIDQLADAFRQDALTRAAGEALGQGDTEGAANALRELADRLDELSPSEQAGLAETLREAAGTIGEQAPELSEALEQAAEALEQGNTPSAADALGQAAEAVESLDGQPPETAAAPSEQTGTEGQGEPSEEAQAQPQENQGPAQEGDSPESQPGQNEGDGAGGGEGEGQGGQGNPPSPPESTPPEGVPLELDPSDEGPPSGPTASEREGQATEGSNKRFVQSNNRSGGDTVTTGNDPLRYPWELRGVIRDYFQQ